MAKKTPTAEEKAVAPVVESKLSPPTRRPSSLVDTRVIYCGDNLEQLAKLPDACVDLIYIDPPFNSNRNYEVFWGETKEKRSFEDRHASTQASFLQVTASPYPAMDNASLPAGWTMTGGVPYLNSDGTINRMIRNVDLSNVGAVTVTTTSGISSKSVVIIVYQAQVELDAQKGNHTQHPFDFGHSRWKLTVQPSDVYPFLNGTDPDTGVPVNLSDGTPYGPQGMGGFYDDQHLNGPGQVIFADPQPDQGTDGVHTATGTYFWCVSLPSYISALQYVYNLAENPPEYRFASVNCTTEAEAVAVTAGVQNVSPTIYPGILSKWLNGLLVVFTGNPTTYKLPQPPACGCPQ
jgi:hypothetical protein